MLNRISGLYSTIKIGNNVCFQRYYYLKYVIVFQHIIDMNDFGSQTYGRFLQAEHRAEGRFLILRNQFKITL